MTTTLLLLRHGQTDWNASGRFQGQKDVPLNSTGHQQAAVAARALAAMNPDALWCSPLTRTRETMAPLAQRTGLPVSYDDRLKEIHVGSWEGLTMETVDQVDPGFRRALAEARDYRRSPQGETATETGLRWASAISDISTAHEGQLVVVVSHGLALRQGVCAFLGWSWEVSQQLGSFDNCSWATLEDRHGRWRLATYNENVSSMMALMDDPSPEQA
ncbi:histidine phosphatase family protein [Aestuariimicrobium sp. p3-SID1156]|uniref:histidine phosphatase family protein n=1 Tax=Aestuariimicrobium sp. p3-SID1156 TaxID=2916038 RepID=UPI00223B2BEC|nr:histidine phosphatase family protein [Aestuariimicrobium sp. p3-SID1156]MCT1459197.1 histidine phosphatase family protein [Aestuariimicrobium sp. p3-SID1156]